LKKEKENANAKSSRIIKRIKEKKFHLTERKRSIKPFKGKKHGHTVVNQSNDNSKYYTETKLLSKDNNKKKPELDKTEKVILIKEEINKSIPAD